MAHRGQGVFRQESGELGHWVGNSTGQPVLTPRRFANRDLA